ncbi:MAG: hypothetical protein GWO21_00095, partial [Gammaproteobacteria bacterium]|nr:hypothetical protein [Gammaproteobacteria bacterium]
TFIAEHEQLQTIESQLAGSMSVGEVRTALQALGLSLKREAADEAVNPSDLICEKTITKKTKEVLSCLSSYEE